MHFYLTIIVPSRRPVCFSRNYNNLASILVKTRYGSLGILGHSLRNKIPIVGKQGEKEVGSRDRFEWK